MSDTILKIRNIGLENVMVTDQYMVNAFAEIRLLRCFLVFFFHPIIKICIFATE